MFSKCTRNLHAHICYHTLY